LSNEAWFCATNFRIYNNRGPSSESGPPDRRIAVDFSPHTYPSFEAAFSGKNLDFVRGGFLVSCPPAEGGGDLEFADDLGACQVVESAAGRRERKTKMVVCTTSAAARATPKAAAVIARVRASASVKAKP
jgi:hypothetical protein